MRVNLMTVYVLIQNVRRKCQDRYGIVTTARDTVGTAINGSALNIVMKNTML
jgi:hypothetical protein